tara:strand:+ start:471 stop:1103 length:633 start_codon:yes stop_codon:yes gene_type:complete
MDKITLIKETFNTIDEISDGDFVTIRNFDDIPDNTSLKNDIDVFLPVQFMMSLAKKLDSEGYDVYQDQLNYMYGAQPHVHFKHKELDVHFDMVTGLYYRSSMNLNLFVNISDELSVSMFKNRKEVDEIWKFQPSPEDELVHLCCHAVFDKRETKPKYSKRINELFKSSDKDKVKHLLDIAFYKVSDAIYDSIVKGDTTDLYKDYMSYSNY